MKTVQELYNEVIASEELKKEFLALKPEEVQIFAAKHGCDATVDEIRSFLTENRTSGELSDDELDQVAGGKGFNSYEALLSGLSVGIACAVSAAVSAVMGDSGTAIKGDAMLCECYEDVSLSDL